MKNLIHILNNYHDPFPHIQGRGGLQFHPSRRIIGGMLGGAEETSIIPAETSETAITSTNHPRFLNDSDDEDANEQISKEDIAQYLEVPQLDDKDISYWKTAPDDEITKGERNDLKTTVDYILNYQLYLHKLNEYFTDPKFVFTNKIKKDFKRETIIINRLLVGYKKLIEKSKEELTKGHDERFNNFLKINIKIKTRLMNELIYSLYTMNKITNGKSAVLEETPMKKEIDDLGAKFILKLNEKLKNGEQVNFSKKEMAQNNIIQRALLERMQDFVEDADRNAWKYVDEMVYLDTILQSMKDLPQRIEKNKKEYEEKRIAEQSIISKASEEALLRELEQEDKGKKSKKKDKKELVKMELRAEEPEPEVIEAEEPEPEKATKKKGGKKEKAEAVETVVDTRTIAEREADLLNSQLAIATNLDNSIENIFKLSEHKGDALTLNDRDKLLKHYIKLGEMPDTYNILKTIAKLQINLKPSKNQLELYRKTQATIDTNKKEFDIIDDDVLKLITPTTEQPDTIRAGDAYEIVLIKKGQNILKSLTGSKSTFVLNSQIPTATKNSDEGIMRDFSSGLDLETLKRAFTYDALNDLFCVELKNYFTIFFLSELKLCGGIVMQRSKFIGRPQFMGSTEQGIFKPCYIIENNILKLYNVCQSYKSSENGPFEKKWIFKGKSKGVYFNVKCRDCLVGMNIKDIPFHLEKMTDPIGTRTDLLTINIEKSIAKGALMKGDTDDTVKIPISYFKPIT